MAGMIAGKHRLARLHALLWVVVRPFWLRKLRLKIQAQRKVPDSEILSHIYSAWYSGAPGGWRGRVNAFLHGYFSFFGLKFKQ